MKNPASTTVRARPNSMTPPRFERVLSESARFAVVIIGIIALIAALAMGKTILVPLSLAIIAGLMFGPVADIFEHRGVPAGLSAAVVVVGFVALLAVATYLFAVPLSEWVGRVPSLWAKLQAQLAGLKQPLESLGAVQDQLKSLTGNDAAMTVQVQDGGPVLDIAALVPALLADVVLFLVGTYFFLATRHHIRIAVLSLFFSRRTRWRAAHVFRDVEQKVSQFLLSAALINAGVGVATALALWALGMPSPLLWGAMAAVLNFIPYVGQAVVVVVLLAVGVATQSSLPSMLLPVVAYGAINMTSDHIVFPHLVGRALTLNPFIIFVSIAFWIFIWGPVGGFVAVPSLLTLQSLILHIFPTTAAIPARTQRKIEEAKVAAEEAAAVAAAEAEAAQAAAAKAEAEARERAAQIAESAAAPKAPRRRAPSKADAARKAAIAGSP